jgi:hypothetical protein
MLIKKDVWYDFVTHIFVKAFCDVTYDAFWRLFHVKLKGTCILVSMFSFSLVGGCPHRGHLCNWAWQVGTQAAPAVLSFGV